jgi:putative transposase
MRILSLNHCTYQHQYHLVWITKFRRQWITPYVKAYLLETLYKTEGHHPTVKILTVNTDKDHIHLQVEIPPDVAVSKVVQALKTNSSREIRKKYAFIRRMYLSESIWAVGYFSSTIGINEKQIHAYIEHQGQEELPRQIRLGI